MDVASVSYNMFVEREKAEGGLLWASQSDKDLDASKTLSATESTTEPHAV